MSPPFALILWWWWLCLSFFFGGGCCCDLSARGRLYSHVELRPLSVFSQWLFGVGAVSFLCTGGGTPCPGLVCLWSAGGWFVCVPRSSPLSPLVCLCSPRGLVLLEVLLSTTVLTKDALSLPLRALSGFESSGCMDGFLGLRHAALCWSVLPRRLVRL
jgi:hypothetical protein